MKANNRRKVFGDAGPVNGGYRGKNGSWRIADASDKENPTLP